MKNIEFPDPAPEMKEMESHARFHGRRKGWGKSSPGKALVL